MSLVNREEFLNQLESVRPGLSPKEIVEQSSCFVFRDRVVYAFNDEVACAVPCNLEVEGAVRAAPLLDLLEKLSEDEIRVDRQKNELIVRGKNQSAGIIMEEEVVLPIDSIDVPKKWRSLPKEFCHAVSIVESCASKDTQQYIATCIHLAPTWVEATDDFQMARYPLKKWRKDSVVVRANSLASVIDSEVVEWGETDAWIHFRNVVGLVVSCRLSRVEFPNMGRHLEVSGQRITLPGGLGDVISKAEVFSETNIEKNSIKVRLKSGRLQIKGEGVSGWYKGSRAVNYDGPAMSFVISPKMLIDIAAHHNDCVVGDGKLKVDTGNYQYVACIEPMPDDDSQRRKKKKRDAEETKPDRKNKKKTKVKLRGKKAAK